ncbi:MAG: hypothetical protein PHZ25_02620, partial [Candidatus Pacebacteria bacterium]|nr:hypothetical protein [Candidatus Paceibacterota bacterium]
REAFDGKLEFDVKIIPYKGDDFWVEETIKNIKKCLDGKKIPEAAEECDYCRYRGAVEEVVAKNPQRLL